MTKREKIKEMLYEGGHTTQEVVDGSGATRNHVIHYFNELKNIGHVPIQKKLIWSVEGEPKKVEKEIKKGKK